MSDRDPLIGSFRLDKTAIESVPLFSEPDDRAYWLSKTPADRWRALEMLRRINYGHDRATARLQRVFDIIEIPWG